MVWQAFKETLELRDILVRLEVVTLDMLMEGV
jgi:hypothetical protein